jgi:hypothetical protein
MLISIIVNLLFSTTFLKALEKIKLIQIIKAFSYYWRAFKTSYSEDTWKYDNYDYIEDDNKTIKKSYSRPLEYFF